MSECPCQIIPGAGVDEAVGRLLVESLQPCALELSIAVQDELAARSVQLDRQRSSHVQRAQFEADQARRRYLAVDPTDRLVADSLEAEWNDKLRALQQAQTDYELARGSDQLTLDQRSRERIASLAEQLPALWTDPATPARHRKRVLAFVIEDVTLIKTERIAVHVRFRGGATRTLDIPIPLNAWQQKSTDPRVLHLVDELLAHHQDAHVARILNARDVLSGAGLPFKTSTIQWLRQRHGLASLQQRLRKSGMLTTDERAERLGVGRERVVRWRRQGRLTCTATSGRGDWMHQLPDTDTLRDLRSRMSTAGCAV